MPSIFTVEVLLCQDEEIFVRGSPQPNMTVSREREVGVSWVPCVDSVADTK